MMTFLNRFRRLQWKLALSYTLSSTLLFLVVVLIFSAIALTFAVRSGGVGGLVQQTLTPVPQQIAPEFVNGSADPIDIQTRLDSYYSNGIVSVRSDNTTTTVSNVRYIAVLDRNGSLLAVEPDGALGASLVWTAAEQTVVDNALAGSVLPEKLLANLADDTSLVTQPIRDVEDESVVGIIAVRFENVVDVGGVARAGLTSFPAVLLMILLVAFVVGAFSALFASRGLVKRLQVLADSAESWATGDFSSRIHDTSPDEIGSLARSLNSMAQQLETLVESRSQLAALEERNKLARDLHDSAKQQMFATTMQLSTAKAMIDVAPEKAKEHLTEAEMLAKQAREELTALIRELRPAQLNGKGLFEAIGDSAETFTRRNAIPIQYTQSGTRELPFAIEQTYFRIVQESLSNIARHSRATTATIDLTATNDTLLLIIHDNGIGFDATATNGVGLNSMRERLETHGGSLHITAAPNNGTTIRATAPLQTL